MPAMPAKVEKPPKLFWSEPFELAGAKRVCDIYIFGRRYEYNTEDIKNNKEHLNNLKDNNASEWREYATKCMIEIMENKNEN